MTKLERLNTFLNKIDVMGIAIELENEYDIEAESLIENFNNDMGLNDVFELFSACMYNFFMTDCVISEEHAHELLNILKSK